MTRIKAIIRIIFNDFCPSFVTQQPAVWLVTETSHVCNFVIGERFYSLVVKKKHLVQWSAGKQEVVNSLNTQVYYIRPFHMKRTQFETNGKQTKLTHSVSLKICLVLLVALSVVIRLITGSLESCKADITLASKWILTLSTKRIPHFSTIQFVWMFSR